MKVFFSQLIKNRIAGIVVLLLFSCSEKQEHVHTGAQDTNIYYTCSMHPQVVAEEPGKCPICKMDLVKVVKSKGQEQMQAIMLSDSQIRLANIQTDTVAEQTINEEITLTGTTVANESQIATVTSFVPGRVERLYFKNTGDVIKAGQVLYEIYSEELLAAQKQYLLTLEKSRLLQDSDIDYQQLLTSARHKLKLWGMTDSQIENLQKRGEVQQSVPVYSKSNGTIVEVLAREGDYITEGGPVFKIADLSSLWVEGQLYANELPYIQSNNEVEVVLAVYPNDRIRGNVSFVNPELLPQSKINLVRVEIPNKQDKYKPGMLAYVQLRTAAREALVVPENAVLREPEGAIVWVKTGENTFESRMVSLGIQHENGVEIRSGLEPSDQVVITGAYLLNSEYIFQHGTGPMASHDHRNMAM